MSQAGLPAWFASFDAQVIVDERVAVHVRPPVNVDVVFGVQPPDQISPPTLGIEDIARRMMLDDPVYGRDRVLATGFAKPCPVQEGAQALNSTCSTSVRR